MAGPNRVLGKREDDKPEPLRIRNEVLDLAAGEDSFTLQLPEAVPEGMIARVRYSVDVVVMPKPAPREQRFTRPPVNPVGQPEGGPNG